MSEMPPSTFINALASFESAVSSELFHGYLHLPIPHELDQQIEQFINAYLSAAPGERELLDCLPQGAADTLLAFGERKAAFAIRKQSQELVVQSLVAIGLASEIPMDIREVLLVLPLPWHSAKLLAADPEEIFKRAATFLPAQGTKLLLDFCKRTPEHQTLGCMGYQASSDEEGFRYGRTW